MVVTLLCYDQNLLREILEDGIYFYGIWAILVQVRVRIASNIATDIVIE